MTTQMKRCDFLFILFVAGCVGVFPPGCSKPDTSTPRKAALAFADALAHNDIKRAGSLCIGSEDQLLSFKVEWDFVYAMGQVYTAMDEKFGKGDSSGNEKSKGPDWLRMSLTEQIRAASEKIDGDTAKLRTGEWVGLALDLRKVNNGWKVDLSEGSKPAAADLRLQQFMSPRMNELTKKIMEGRYKTRQEVETELANIGRGAPGAEENAMHPLNTATAGTTPTESADSPSAPPKADADSSSPAQPIAYEGKWYTGPRSLRDVNEESMKKLLWVTKLKNVSGRPVRAFRATLQTVNDFGEVQKEEKLEFSSESPYGTSEMLSYGHIFQPGEILYYHYRAADKWYFSNNNEIVHQLGDDPAALNTVIDAPDVKHARLEVTQIVYDQ